MEILRRYGNEPYKVIVVHGGPGGAGEMAPVARELSKNIGVLEPMQTKDTVGGQVSELEKVIRENNEEITLIGWSWGAWLALLTAERYSKFIKKLILISSGPFEQKYADQIMKTRVGRFSDREKLEFNGIVESLEKGNGDKDDLFARFGKMLSKVDSFDELPHKEVEITVDEKINFKVWSEAEMLRKTGELLKMAQNVKIPIVAIHGEYDPHPWRGVEEPLKSVCKNFKFILLEKCGHHPWYEKFAKDKFYKILQEEILS